MAVEIIATVSDDIFGYGLCGCKNFEKERFRRKIEWLKDRVSEGVKIKTFYQIRMGVP